MSQAHYQPIISIITATYNRSNVLRLTIESVLHSTFRDWELLIVGDACTDDTAEVVGRFDDPRIQFKNLEKNFGDQSGPNNVGFEMAKGQYIAYLNHDDLFFPNHLQSSLDMLIHTGADLVFSATAIAWPRSLEALQRGDWGFHLVSTSPTGQYEPYVFAPASSWLLHRRLIENIGPWRPASECYAEPSQDFLFRAWKTGKDLKFNPQVTVLVLYSGERPNVYRNREHEENEFYCTQMIKDPKFREKVLNQTAVYLSCESFQRYISFNFKDIMRRLLRKMLYKPILWMGINPKTMRKFIRYRSKGAYIRNLRRKRGL